MSYLIRYWDRVLVLVGQHLVMTGLAIGVALAVALALGAALSASRRLRTPVLGLLGVVYTIPSMALFALLIPLTGLGRTTAVTALVAYCQVLLVRNIVVGLAGVSPAVLEAAAGMGLSPWQVFWTIRLPLALPVMLAGVRIAAVSAIGIGTIAAWINAGGIGVLLFEGLYQDHTGKIVIGTAAVSLLALGANRGLHAVEQRVRRWTGG